MLVLGLWWKRATRMGAMTGMVVGLVITFAYILGNRFGGFEILGIKDVAGGIFGMVANFSLSIVVSLLTPAPDPKVQEVVTSIRYGGTAREPAPAAGR